MVHRQKEEKAGMLKSVPNTEKKIIKETHFKEEVTHN